METGDLWVSFETVRTNLIKSQHGFEQENLAFIQLVNGGGKIPLVATQVKHDGILLQRVIQSQGLITAVPEPTIDLQLERVAFDVGFIEPIDLMTYFSSQPRSK